MRPRARFLALVTLLLAPGSVAAVENDFSDYPAGAQKCLSNAADASGCGGNTVAQLNACLCGNTGNFVLATAQCVAGQDSGDLKSVYETLKVHCEDSNTPISIDEDRFLATAAAATSTTSTSTATATSTQGPASPTKTSDSDGTESNGLSHSATIAVAAVSAVAGTGVLAASIFFAIRYSRRNQGAQDESHPMLSQPQGYGGSGEPTGGSLGAQPNLSGAAWPSWRQDEQKKFPYGPDDVAAVNTPLQPEVFELADTTHNPEPTPPIEMPVTPARAPVSGDAPGPDESDALYEPYRSR